VLTRRVDSPEPPLLAAIKYRPYRIVIAISRAVEAELARSAAVVPRLRRIASAVDGERFRPDAAARRRVLDAFALADDTFIVASVAQLIPRKGHRLLLQAWRDFQAQTPAARLLLFGRGPEEPALRRAVAAAGLEAYVKFVGFHDAIEHWLPGLDLLVHPAEREGLGAVVLEAMSAGLPVLAARAGGIVDLIESGVDGLLADPGDRAGWVRGLERLAGDADLRARLAAAARAKAARDFTIEAMTERYLEVYEAVRAGA
jgi:glycosyltransferase involved in cell wall biosynthesis